MFSPILYISCNKTRCPNWLCNTCKYSPSLMINKTDCSTECHYLPQGRGLTCQSCNHNPHSAQEYLAGLDPKLLREAGCVKDRGMVSLNHNEVCDFLFMKKQFESRLITWHLLTCMMYPQKKQTLFVVLPSPWVGVWEPYIGVLEPCIGV